MANKNKHPKICIFRKHARCHPETCNYPGRDCCNIKLNQGGKKWKKEL